MTDNFAFQELLNISTIRHWCANGKAKNIRLNAGVTQFELARAVNVSTAAINRWENGGRNPRHLPGLRYLDALDALISLTAELDIDIEHTTNHSGRLAWMLDHNAD